MNLEDVKLFLEICKNRNLSVTASNLYLAQPTVSRRLSSLEQDLGYQLIVRGKGHEDITLTPTGKRFYLIAQKIRLLEEDARSLARYADIQHLSIASTDSIASYPLRKFFHKVSKEQTTWDIDMAIHDSQEIYEMISNRIVDVGITNGASPIPSLSSTLIFEEEFVVVRRGEKKPGWEWVHPRDLKENHEIFQIFSQEYQYWHNSWWSSGISKVRVNLAHFTVEFLNDPEDWAILPLSVAKGLLPEDGYLSHLLESPPKRRCYLILNKTLSPEQRGVIQEFKKQLLEFVLKSGLNTPNKNTEETPKLTF